MGAGLRSIAAARPAAGPARDACLTFRGIAPETIDGVVVSIAGGER